MLEWCWRLSQPQRHCHLVFEEIALGGGDDDHLVGWGVVEGVVLAVVPRRRHKPPSSWTAHNCCMGSDGCIVSCASCRLSKTWWAACVAAPAPWRREIRTEARNVGNTTETVDRLLGITDLERKIVRRSQSLGCVEDCRADCMIGVCRLPFSESDPDHDSDFRRPSPTSSFYCIPVQIAVSDAIDKIKKKDTVNDLGRSCLEN